MSDMKRFCFIRNECSTLCMAYDGGKCAFVESAKAISEIASRLNEVADEEKSERDGDAVSAV